MRPTLRGTVVAFVFAMGLCGTAAALPARAGDDALRMVLSVSAPEGGRAATLVSLPKLHVEIRNRGQIARLILSHIVDEARRRHLDPFELDIERLRDGKSWRIDLIGLRKASLPVACELAPGAALEHSLDLAEWLGPQRVAMGAGEFRARLRYRVADDRTGFHTWSDCATPDAPIARSATRPVWHGTLVSNAVRLRLPPP